MLEFEIIKNYFSKLATNNKNSLDLNDDVFFDKDKNLVVSVDTYIEGVHFIDFKKPDMVIKKILRSSISDIICKGVKPKYYFISGSGNSNSFTKKNLKKISQSLKQEQKKYSIKLCGGDTVYSDKLSFTITCIGFSNKIVFRNKAKLDDDIYVSGVLGDSFIGLNVLKKKIHLSKSMKKYFIKKYFLPNLSFKLANKLITFANSSIDISDGLIADMDKLINNQRLSYRLKLNDIPVSKNFQKLINKRKINKTLSISNGDDYQILFTAPPSKSRNIYKTCKYLGIKISKIGKICSDKVKSQIIDRKGIKIRVKNKGYSHKF